MAEIVSHIRMTLDQAKAHLEGIVAMKRNEAAAYRQRGDEYKAAANEGYDGLQRQHFDQSSECYAKAREVDRDADAIDIVLGRR